MGKKRAGKKAAKAISNRVSKTAKKAVPDTSSTAKKVPPRNKPPEGQNYHLPPKDGKLPSSPDAQRVGTRGGRRTWEDKKYIYQWDAENGRVEKYNKKTKEHLGEYDHKTGEQTKPGKKNRRPSGYD